MTDAATVTRPHAQGDEPRWNGPDELKPLLVPISQLQPLPGNPRRGDTDAVARSLERFGQRKPVTYRPSDGIITAGNHTRAGAEQLGWTHVAAVAIEEPDADAKAWALADNRTSDLATNDDADLAAMLEEIRAADAELLAAASYTTDDVDELLAALGHTAEPAPAPAAADEPPPARTQRGDLWLLGPHRILCGDCRDADDVEALFGDEIAALAFTSPPYADRRKYDESTEFRPIHPDEYVEWFADVAALVERFLTADGSWFVNIAPHADDGQRSLYVNDLVAAHVPGERAVKADVARARHVEIRVEVSNVDPAVVARELSWNPPTRRRRPPPPPALVGAVR